MAARNGTTDRVLVVVGSANSGPDISVVNILSQIIEFVAGNCVWRLYGRFKGYFWDAVGFARRGWYVRFLK